MYYKNKCENRVYNIVQKFAPHAKKILDLGCGKCCTTQTLIQQGKDVTSLDIIDKGECEKPVLFNGIDIPFDDKEFDLGICSFVLHHTETQIELLKELKRTCRQIIILENTPENENEWKYVEKHAESEWGKCMKCFKTAEEWNDVFISLDLNIENMENMSKWYCPFSDKPFFYPVTCTCFLLS